MLNRARVYDDGPMRWLLRSLTVLFFMPLVCASANAAEKPPFTLTISGPESATVGDEIKIKAVLKNISSQKVEIEWGIQHTILIHAENGEEPRPKSGIRVYAGSSGRLSFAPGQTSLQYVVLTGEHGDYDLSKPGKYVVRLQRPMEDAGYPKGSMVESNQIIIAIVPKRHGGSK